MSEIGLFIPEGYSPKLDMVETEIGIKIVKDTFERELANNLNLLRVSAPLFVEPSTGLNDNLNGVERPVSFDILNLNGAEAEIVHSLAKWKRLALHRLGMKVGEGLYTDMNAIRRDEEFDNIHSIYVDQWDWEKVIDRKHRTVQYLQETVQKIVTAFKATEQKLHQRFPQLVLNFEEKVTFVTSQELEDRYPALTPKERENKICKEHKTVFISQIGKTLKSGKKHDGRAPDYDDWDLNGDILVWYEPLKMAVELSSMGIRVDEKSLDTQLTAANCDDRRELPYHKMLLNGELPLTIGGGIGQSRMCLLLMEKAHIGEVQAGVWPNSVAKEAQAAKISLL